MVRNVRVVTGPAYAPQDRAEAMADALTARALRPRAPQQGGRVAVAMSPWEGIAQLGEAGIAAALSKRAMKLAEAEQQRKLASNDAMIRQLAGTKTEDRAPMAIYGQQVPNDERIQALTAALGGMDPATANQVLSGQVLQRTLGDPAQEEAYTLTPGSARFRGDKQIASMPTAPDKEPEQIRALRAMLDNPELLAAEQSLKRAGASNTNVNMPYDNKWAAATAENDAKRLDTMRASADSARGALRSVQRLRQINPGAAAGGTAQARMTAANILAGLGFNIDPKLAASQEFDAIASRMVIDSLGGSLGTGFSNADRDFVTRTVPQIGHSMEARTALLNFMEGKFNQQVQDYNQADAYARKHNGLQGYNPNPPVTKVYNPVTGKIEDAPQ